MVHVCVPFLALCQAAVPIVIVPLLLVEYSPASYMIIAFFAKTQDGLTHVQYTEM